MYTCNSGKLTSKHAIWNLPNTQSRHVRMQQLGGQFTRPCACVQSDILIRHTRLGQDTKGYRHANSKVQKETPDVP